MCCEASRVHPSLVINELPHMEKKIKSRFSAHFLPARPPSLGLKQTSRPGAAGEHRNLLTGETVFLSPLQLKVDSTLQS